MKRSVILPIILLVYLLVMSYIGWPYYSQQDKYLEYFGIIGITLVVIVCLYFFLKRRDRFRKENRKRKDASMRRNFRDDKIR